MGDRLKSLTLRNFKSFEDVTVEFGDINVVVGANASGKSSLLEGLRFLRDIARFDLDNAVSMQGGVEFLRNRRIGTSRDLEIEFIIDTDRRLLTHPSSPDVTVKRIAYRFSLHFAAKGAGYHIKTDELTLTCSVGSEDVSDSADVRMFRSDWRRGSYRIEIGPGLPSPKHLSPFGGPPGASRAFPIGDQLLLELPGLPFFLIVLGETGGWAELLSRLAIFDFDPKLSKKSVPISGKMELEEDGSNLAIVLQRVSSNAKTKRRFDNLLREALPFIEDVSVQRHVDRSVMFRCTEKHDPDSYYPSPLLSDGTVNIASLIAALYFERHDLAVIEEPERNLHPALVRQVATLLQDAATKRQVLVTTHSPEMVKYSGLENLLLVSRDSEGFTTVERPVESNCVASFLEKEIGLDSLYTMNLLEEK